MTDPTDQTDLTRRVAMSRGWCNVRIEHGVNVVGTPPGEDGEWTTPHWATDLNAAIELFQEIAEVEGYEKTPGMSYWVDEGAYCVALAQSEYSDHYDHYTAPTLAEAICLAWLAWKEDQ